MRTELHHTGEPDSRPRVGQPHLYWRYFADRCISRLIVWMPVLLFVPLVSSPANAQEARCAELGAACDCSEPMGPQETYLPDDHNLSDSPSGTECERWGQPFWNTNKTGSDATTVPEFGMPAGNTVDRVIQLIGAGEAEGTGSIVWLRGRMTVPDNIKRTCIRYYKMVSNDYSGVGPNSVGCPSERNKIIQAQFGNQQNQMQERADGSICTGPGTGNDYSPITITNVMNNPGEGNVNLAPRVDWEDCWQTNGWCRIEMCVSGNLNQGTNINIAGNIHTLWDGVDHHGDSAAERGYTTNPGVPMRADTAGDLFHGQGRGGKGKEWISHFMQASWTTDDNQWIGAAYEVEGGKGGPPPPPPLDEPPLAPFLLPEDPETPPSGDEAMTVDVFTGGSGPTVSALVTNGIGPYHFLFDCGLDGNWNGVETTLQPTASYTCGVGTSSIKAQVWDEGTNAVLSEVVPVAN